MWSQVRSGPSGTTDESEAGSRPSKAIHSENLGPQRSSQGPENTLTICAAFTSCSLRSISNSKTAELQKLSTAQVAGTGLLQSELGRKVGLSPCLAHSNDRAWPGQEDAPSQNGALEGGGTTSRGTPRGWERQGHGSSLEPLGGTSPAHTRLTLGF